MTDPAVQGQLKALEARLQQLERKLSDDVSSLARRRKRFLVGFIVVVLAMIGYLCVTYTYVAGHDADKVLNMIEPVVDTKLDELLQTQTDQLVQAAPQNVKKLEEMVVSLPKKLSDHVATVVQIRLQEEMPKIETALKDQIGAAVATAKSQLMEAKADKDLEHPAKFNAAMEKAVKEVFGHARAVVNKNYHEFSVHSSNAATYLTALAENKDLNARQQHQRAVIISGLGLFEKYSQTKGE